MHVFVQPRTLRDASEVRGEEVDAVTVGVGRGDRGPAPAHSARKHNGKVESYNRPPAGELLYAREWTSEVQRAAAIEAWGIHYNYHRPHTATGDQPPASRLRAGVTNVMTQNS